jgi:proteasome assembly chaperone (PAC2) family protein
MIHHNDQNRPLLVAVWPGMGQVALTAGYYLMSKLHMHETDPLPAQDLFDVDEVDIQDGLVHTARLPKTRVFHRKDPATRREIVVLIGEAQPPAGKLAFCGRLLDYAERLDIREVFTFAAMADEVPLRSPPRVFGVATHTEGRDKLRGAGVPILSSGRIAGLNGVLLGVAAQRGFQGLGLLGEMPALVTPVPFAKASAAVLEAFQRLSGIQIELQELQEYGRSVENQLAEVIDDLQKRVRRQIENAPEESEPTEPEPRPAVEESRPTPTGTDRRRLEELFEQATRERTKTFELKRELDRLGVFAEYEDRFLNLFRKPPEK